MRAWHSALTLAASPATPVEELPRHENAAESPCLPSGARRAQHHWRQLHAETLQAPGHYLRTTGWRECAIRSRRFPHLLSVLVRQCSGGGAAAANPRRDGDSGTSAARCPGG